MFGLFLKMTGRLALVVGGGAVGQRKMRALRASGAAVRVVCLETRPDGYDVEWLTEAFAARHLDGVSLAVAAATVDVNAAVVREARARGVWVCDAITPDEGDFVMPALVRRGGVTLAVATGVPALTRALRARMEDAIGAECGEWAAMLHELRPRILTLPPERRAALWERLTGDEWPARLRADADAAWAEMVRLCSEGASG